MEVKNGSFKKEKKMERIAIGSMVEYNAYDGTLMTLIITSHGPSEYNYYGIKNERCRKIESYVLDPKAVKVVGFSQKTIDKMKEKKEVKQDVFGVYANECGYSDVHPYEVISKPTEKRYKVRAMKVGKQKTKLDFHVGGFLAHCSNQNAQEWDIESDPEGKVFDIRLQKNGTWKDANGRRFNISDTPVKFYDYNF